MDDLNELLDQARAADPLDRISLRDPIAAHGPAAIPPMRAWLEDARLGAFAVRVLERIGSEPDQRRAVLAAFAGIDSSSVSAAVASDVTQARFRMTGNATGTTPSGRSRPASDWPGARQVSALELRFHDAMLDIFRLAGEATRKQRSDGTIQRGYWASYFLRGVRNHGGPDYARRLLAMTGTTEGFERLRLEGRLDLTMEALVLQRDYESLFTPEERRTASSRLARAGYQPKP